MGLASYLLWFSAARSQSKGHPEKGPTQVWSDPRGRPSLVSSDLLELELGLLFTPPAGVCQLPSAPQARLVPGLQLLSFPSLLKIFSLPQKTLNCLVLKVTRICVEHLMWEEEKVENVTTSQRTTPTDRVFPQAVSRCSICYLTSCPLLLLILCCYWYIWRQSRCYSHIFPTTPREDVGQQAEASSSCSTGWAGLSSGRALLEPHEELRIM